jgi:hypothetical protein
LPARDDFCRFTCTLLYYFPGMEPAPCSKTLKALIAPGRHCSGPTLYLLVSVLDGAGVEVHEQLPDGTCVVWPERPMAGTQQAEGAIYQWARDGKFPVD